MQQISGSPLAELQDRNGTTHFRYAMPYDEAGRPAADERITAIRSYLV